MAILCLSGGNSEEDQEDAVMWMGVPVAQQEVYHLQQHLTSAAVSHVNSYSGYGTSGLELASLNRKERIIQN